jgi:hypothetical protein
MAGIAWRDTFDAALSESRETHRLVLVDFFHPG